MSALKNEAFKVFEQKGFPKKKDEEWKYTNILPLLKTDYVLNAETESSLSVENIKEFLVPGLDSYTVVFVNGIFNEDLSDVIHEDGKIAHLSFILEREEYKDIVARYFGKVAVSGEGLISLNTAFAQEGAFIHIPAHTIVSKPVQVLFLSTGQSEIMYQPRNLIVIEDNAQVQIIERHHTLNEKANLTNVVSEIYVGKNSFLDYYKIQNDAHEASLIDHTFIEQERDSKVDVCTFSFGGKLTRNNLNFIQNGENCNSSLNGITVISGKQHVDHHTMVKHNYPYCESHELYKGIYGQQSHGVFNGKVIVAPEAQKLNAFQQNNNILLSDEAEIDTKPQLEIFADDVKCSHGCTVGQLDEEALFYMQQRGIPTKEAKALLLFAFAADVMEHVQIVEISTFIKQLIASKLEVHLDF